MNRKELELETEHLDLLERLTAAKAGKDREELRDTKLALTAFRQKWRGIHAYLNPADPGEARPKTAAVKLKKGR